MSDYLTRLAARALGQVEVVQPRLPSLFEAGPAALEELVLGDAPLAGAESGGLFREPRAHRQISEAERHEAPARGAAEAPPGVEDPALPTRKPAAPAASRPSVTRRPSDDVEPAGRGPWAPRGETLEPPDEQQQAAPARERPGAAREQRNPEAIPLTTRPRPAVVVERPARGDAPSVRVTIGRVEVRAIAPPPRPAPARPRPPVPRLSLEEYVRLRDEGKR